jgi:spore coat polysaccharide biosynthesis protein SpsF
MLNTLGIVHARAGAPGAKDRVSRKLGGRSLLERVVRRVTDCQRLDGVAVVVGDSPEDEVIARLVPHDVPVFVAAARDELARFVAAIDHFQAQAVVRVYADNPFIDPVFVDRLVATALEHPECDYISYCSGDGRPIVLSSLGVFAEWCRADALRRAHREATAPADRDLVTRYLYCHPEIFRLRLIPVPTELDRDDLRLTVDQEEDWEHVHTLYDALGPEGLDWRRIADLLTSHPAVRERMAILNRQRAEV